MYAVACNHQMAALLYTVLIYSVSQKKVAPLKLFAIFSLGLSISVASFYLHILTNFGRFVLIFNKMVLIFLGVPIVFNVSSFKFYKVKSPTLSPIMNGLQIYLTSIYWIIRLG